MDLTRLLGFFATITTALMAGLFFTWWNAVVPGLMRLPDQHYLSAMQSMDRAILNPLFFLGFMGATIALPLCAWLQQRSGASGTAWLWSASIVYLVGVLGITSMVNVPLNNMLGAMDLGSASPERMAQVRASFAPRWNFFNTMRTFAAIASLVLVLIAWLRPFTKAEA